MAASTALVTFLMSSTLWSEQMSQFDIDMAVEVLFAADDEKMAALEFTNKLREAEVTFSLVVIEPNNPVLLSPEQIATNPAATAVIRVGDAIYLWRPKAPDALHPFFLE